MIRKIAGRRAALLALVLAFPLTVEAQTAAVAGGSGEPMQKPHRRITLSVVVSDSSGRAVGGLGAADFVVLDDAIPKHQTSPAWRRAPPQATMRSLEGDVRASAKLTLKCQSDVPISSKLPSGYGFLKEADMQLGALVRRLASEESGAGMLEYAVIAGVIAIAAVMSMKSVVQALNAELYNGSLKAASYWPGW